MAKVFLKFNLAVIKEIELEKPEYTFGRKSTNDIVIDNPAISGTHGKIVKEADGFYVIDLNSTNGTYVNGHKVNEKVVLKHKDQIGIARHVLEFSDELALPKPAAPVPPPAAEVPPPPAPPVVDKPLIVVDPSTPAHLVAAKPAASPTESPLPSPLETKPTAPAASVAAISPEERERQLKILKESVGITPPLKTSEGQPKTELPVRKMEGLDENQSASLPPEATLKIIAGGADAQTEFKLRDLVTYIGTADQAVVKIKGFLAPGLAAAISRRSDGYFLKAVKKGYPKVNGNAVLEQVLLDNGSLIEVGNTNMVFYTGDKKNKAK